MKVDFKLQLKSSLKNNADNYSEDSSDSEEEVEKVKKNFKTKKDKESVDQARRKYKASMLAAIAESVFLPNKETLKLYEELENLRKKDGYENYSEETIKAAREIAENFLNVSLIHNPYLRRAFRKAVGKDLVKNSDSNDYKNKQGQIRTKLAEIIEEDYKKMKFTKEDFPDNEDLWNVIKYMAQGKEIPGTIGKNSDFKSLLKKLPQNEVGDKGAAFHHIVWKNAFDSLYEDVAALNPSNLALLNDARDKKNDHSKIGNHDKLHSSGAYPSEHKNSEGGGRFVDMDPEMVTPFYDTFSQARTPKSEVYKAGAQKLSEIAALENNKNTKGAGRI